MRYLYIFLTILLIDIAVSNSLADWSDYETAIRYYQLASFDSSLYFAKKIPQTDTLYFYSQLLIGHIYLITDSLELAKEKFEALLPDSKMRFHVYNGLGLYYLYKYEKNNAVGRLLKKIFSSDDLDRAKELFDRAIRLQPDYLDARLNKCRALLISDNREENLLALQQLKDLEKSYPDNLEIMFYRGECSKNLGNDYEAMAVYDQVLKIDEWHPGANLSISFIYLDQEQYELFSEYYLRSLRYLYDQLIIRELYRDIFDILADTERKKAESTRLTGEFFLEFWKMRDPIPMTPENERLIEHYKRLKFARTHYPGSNTSGYDDRGKIYVKYGEANDIARSLSQEGYVLENESWIYHIAGETYNFDFVDEGSGYVLKKDLSDAVTNPDFRMAVLDLQDLYSRRAHLSNYYANIYRELLSVNPSTAARSIMNVSSIINRYSLPEISKKEQLPRSVYEVKLTGSDLNFDFDTFTFYDTLSGQGLLDIYYGIDLGQIEYRYRDNTYTGEIEWRYRIVSPLASEPIEENRKIQLVSKDNFLNNYYLGKVNVSLFNGLNQVQFQLKNEAANKFRIIEKNIRIFPRDSILKMSSILLSDDIHTSNFQDDTLFRKSDFYIHPVLSRRFSKGQSVYCYFELYNINLSENHVARYQIETRIQDYQTGRNLSSLLRLLNPFGKNEPSPYAVSILNEFEFTKNNEAVVLGFNVSHLVAGVYQLFVKVTDLHSSATANSDKLLQLID